MTTAPTNETPWADALAEVWYEFREYGRSGDPLAQAHHLIELSNAISDLSSWHPNYNAETGYIDGVYEDES